MLFRPSSTQRQCQSIALGPVYDREISNRCCNTERACGVILRTDRSSETSFATVAEPYHHHQHRHHQQPDHHHRRQSAWSNGRLAGPSTTSPIAFSRHHPRCCDVTMTSCDVAIQLLDHESGQWWKDRLQPMTCPSRRPTDVTLTQSSDKCTAHCVHSELC